MSRPRRAVLTALVMVSLVAGCGGGVPGDLHEAAAAELAAGAAAVREAAEAGDHARARAELDELRATLRHHHEEGRVDDERAAYVARAADHVAAMLPEADAAPDPEPEPDDNAEPDAEPEPDDNAEPDDNDEPDADAEVDDDHPHGGPPGRERGRGQGRGGGRGGR